MNKITLFSLFSIVPLIPIDALGQGRADSLASSYSTYLTILFWISLVSVVGLRLLSMWAFDDWALKRAPFLQFFNPNNWLIFRALSLPVAVILSLLGCITHSYGHAIGNGFYALVALSPSVFKGVGQIFTKASSFNTMFLVFGVPSALAGMLSYLVLDGSPLFLQLGYSFQVTGNVLMCMSFCAMMAGAWGPSSAGSLHYLVLATFWDVILLVAVYLLWVGGQPVFEFIVFEVCILFTEFLRWGAMIAQLRKNHN